MAAFGHPLMLVSKMCRDLRHDLQRLHLHLHLGFVAIQVPKYNFLLHPFNSTHNFQTDTTVAVERNVLNSLSTSALVLN